MTGVAASRTPYPVDLPRIGLARGKVYRYPEHSPLLEVQRGALSKGGVIVRPGVVHLDASGKHWKCLNPLDMIHKGQGAERVIYRVRCRRCEACLRQRNVDWVNRARRESGAAARTWFTTLTMRPEVHEGIKTLVLSMIADKSDHDYIAKRIIEESYRQVHLFFKRIRKNTGKAFRYLAVIELHKNGLPHFHLLVHDNDGTLQRRDIDNQWKAGFTSSRLVKGDNEKAIAYVCKYLCKDTEGRIKCSLNYGRCGLLPKRGEPGGNPEGEPTSKPEGQGKAAPQGEAASAERLTHLSNLKGAPDACSTLAHGLQAERADARPGDGPAAPGAACEPARLSRASSAATGGPKAATAATGFPACGPPPRAAGSRQRGQGRVASRWRFSYGRLGGRGDGA